MLSVVPSGALHGVDALAVDVEVNTGERGDPRVVMVGLPDTAVKESQDRVASALTNTGFKMPATRTTINLAPGDLRKEGPFYDLPIALGILLATEQIKTEAIGCYVFGGELSLSGELRPNRGGLAMAILARDSGKHGVVLPRAAAEEAAFIDGTSVYPVDSLDEAIRFIKGELEIEPIRSNQSPYRLPSASESTVDFSDVKGQAAVRRAVEIAVAGGHNILMIGPPGSGKSMIAKRIPTIMPMPSNEEFQQILAIQSAAGISLKAENRCFQRPFRSPHHTISNVGLLGGGTIPGPGEISLAHNGVLFLDELPEFTRSSLEVLRQPMEDGEVTISRSAGKITLPSSFMLVAAMNPCPCGYLGDKKRECRCTPTQIQRYRARISGPLLDRIDIHIEAPPPRLQELGDDQPAESSAAMRERLESARALQVDRFRKNKTTCNARMEHKQIKEHCVLEKEHRAILEQAMEQLHLSARAYDRILKLSRTIADLAGSDRIDAPHLLEAIQYRNLDRQVFY